PAGTPPCRRSPVGRAEHLHLAALLHVTGALQRQAVRPLRRQPGSVPPGRGAPQRRRPPRRLLTCRSTSSTCTITSDGRSTRSAVSWILGPATPPSSRASSSRIGCA